MSPGVARDIAVVLATALGIVVVPVVAFGTLFVVLLVAPPSLSGLLCAGTFVCWLGFLVVVPPVVGIELAAIGWVYERGYLTLPEPW